MSLHIVSGWLALRLASLYVDVMCHIIYCSTYLEVLYMSLVLMRIAQTCTALCSVQHAHKPIYDSVVDFKQMILILFLPKHELNSNYLRIPNSIYLTVTSTN